MQPLPQPGHVTSTPPSIPRPAHQPASARASKDTESLTLAVAGDALYDRACLLSSEQYRRHFDCDLQHFYPQYLCLERNGRLLGVCGYRNALGPLYLEQYLDAPVETLLTERCESVIERQSIVEVGGFALSKRALALYFMASLAPAFQQLGFTHAVCTATLPVRRCLRSLAIPSKHLGKALAERIVESDTDWGNYYVQRPAVIGGAIAATSARVEDLLPDVATL